ncbi:MAG: hypothetical protein UR25_C0003G0126 [Candidatus Nomurabacteria bacterium GW2011_GWE1_32_28]|uniref:Uncharacterized protein n=1 Tax=Candidatus Nomurabacteria bacterium GW2011_GWF1_31_48 TaxID=1618767 RepID=A0A0F9YFZ5_9BACT|nr:MAG: hypothetical protein UR19_C0003G0179 [Candidatus Nomurabacteria bacterium GW2011_GWF1_31_48]KKP34870.1 MAG: hypothetical protein UR25_C0003G0126 [Candidatus Nomurabacteria bacterium GW2011_GWE1_32_28]
MYVFPFNVPLQPETELIAYPEYAVTVNVAVLPELTVIEL